jgi:N-acetylglutamate synthase-like GNAT family acetyltransferase
VRKSKADDYASILAIINEAAQAYRGVIPDDRWHDPYMSAIELDAEIRASVEFWCYELGSQVIGVMGCQRVQDVTLIRHAYVRAGGQRKGVGGALLAHLRANNEGRMLVGTWAAADWAISFYQRQGFELVDPSSTPELLRQYWQIPERQIEESVVLASPRWSG